MIMFIIRENVFTVLAPTDEAFAGCFFQTIIYHSPYQFPDFNHHNFFLKIDTISLAGLGSEMKARLFAEKTVAEQVTSV